jgi:hypothetical protein
MVKASQEQIETAANHMLANVYQPVFFRKMAERGHVPKTAEDARRMLNTAFKLAAAGVQPEPTKEAGLSKYAMADEALDRLASSQENLNDDMLKRAAVQLAQDPTLYQSVLLLHESEKQAAEEEAAAGNRAANDRAGGCLVESASLQRLIITPSLRNEVLHNARYLRSQLSDDQGEKHLWCHENVSFSATSRREAGGRRRVRVHRHDRRSARSSDP